MCVCVCVCARARARVRSWVCGRAYVEYADHANVRVIRNSSATDVLVSNPLIPFYGVLLVHAVSDTNRGLTLLFCSPEADPTVFKDHGIEYSCVLSVSPPGRRLTGLIN